MTAESGGRQSGIYDLGYQPYEGARLGWRYSLQSLYLHSLRAVFGVGRPLSSKVFPLGFALIAMIPALLQLGIAAIVPREISLIRPENYFGYVQIVLALFCAAVAPELMGRDQRMKTLALYFSRALTRSDYVTAKLGAMFTALLAVVWAPQAILLVGNAVATEDTLDYLGENIDLVPPIVAAGLTVATFMGSVSLAIACQTSRRSFSTAAVLGTFVVLSTLGGILVNTTSGDVQKYSVLISPLDVLAGAVDWLFGAAPAARSDLALADLPGGLYVLAAAAYSLVALVLLYRRYERLAV